MGPHTQPGEGFHQDTRHFLTTASCQALAQIMPTSLQEPPVQGPRPAAGRLEEEEEEEEIEEEYLACLDNSSSFSVGRGWYKSRTISIFF